VETEFVSQRLNELEIFLERLGLSSRILRLYLMRVSSDFYLSHRVFAAKFF